MKNQLLILMGLIQFTLPHSGHCSVLASPAENVDPTIRFPGYSPTVMESEAQVSDVFKGMIGDFKEMRPWELQFGSQCTQRAETWSYDLNQGKGLRLQKVFVFYTTTFKNYYYQLHHEKFKWWFHVSPYLLVKTASGAVEERVIDKEFSDQPQTMKGWTDLFIDSKQACIENVPFANFEGDVTGQGASYDHSAHCYIVRAPMYDMYPEDIDLRERGQNSKLEWNLNQVLFASKALPMRARKEFYKRVGLN